MFDPVAQRPLRLMQRPLIAMECSVIRGPYLGPGYGPASLSLFQRCRQRREALKGHFNLLWHNNSLATSQQREFYRNVYFG